MVNVEELFVSGVKLITLDRYSDLRGWINESWRDSWSNYIEVPYRFVQDMLSWNDHAYTLRGMHALSYPVQQYKLVSVVNGKLFDVVVDARKDSPTYGKHVALELSKSNPSMILIPPGCYHGYVTLEPNTAVAYKVTHYHSKEYDSGILWNDPELSINWPIAGQDIIISDRDKAHPLLKDL